MTQAELVFDPFSEEYFDNPYEIYRRMRDEAPVYYDAEKDFYALTRHEDVAAAFKDHETFSSARGCDLAMVQVRRGAAEVDHLHGPAGAPAHAQPAEQGVHPARHPGSARHRRRARSTSYLSAADPDDFDVVQDFSGPFPVEVITRMAGVPEEYRQQVRHWIDTGCTASPARSRSARPACRPTSTTAMYYYGLVQERRAEPAGRHDQPADRRRDPRRGRQHAPARRHRDHRLRNASGRRRRRDRHQAGRHAPW